MSNHAGLNTVTAQLKSIAPGLVATPHFEPPSKKDGNNFAAMTDMRCIEGMLLVNSEHPGQVAIENFKKEFALVTEHTGNAQLAAALLKRAADTVAAIMENPDKSAHQVEKRIALHAAREAGLIPVFLH